MHPIIQNHPPSSPQYNLPQQTPTALDRSPTTIQTSQQNIPPQIRTQDAKSKNADKEELEDENPELEGEKETPQNEQEEEENIDLKGKGRASDYDTTQLYVSQKQKRRDSYLTEVLNISDDEEEFQGSQTNVSICGRLEADHNLAEMLQRKEYCLFEADGKKKQKQKTKQSLHLKIENCCQNKHLNKREKENDKGRKRINKIEQGNGR